MLHFKTDEKFTEIINSSEATKPTRGIRESEGDFLKLSSTTAAGKGRPKVAITNVQRS